MIRVGSSTTRRDPEAPEDVPGAQRERRRVWLVIQVEQVETHDFSGHGRLTGPIVEGPFDIGRHHTLDLFTGDDLTLLKEEVTAADRALLDEGLDNRTSRARSSRALTGESPRSFACTDERSRPWRM